MRVTLDSMRRRLTENLYKSNGLIGWLFGHESPRAIKKYQDMSIEFDMIHEWLREDQIYRG